jgi:hypothetical protein
MATKVKFNNEQQQIGKLLGFDASKGKQKDLDRINEFARVNGIKTLNKQHEVDRLTPLVAGWLNRGTTAQTQAQAQATPAPAEAYGQAGPDAMQGLLMQQSSAITQQESYFDQLLKQQQLEQQQQSDQLSAIRQQYETQQATHHAEFAKQQEAWNQELLAQQQKLNNTTNAAGSAPGAVAGWKPNTSGIKTLEELLMGSTANTSAMASFSTVLA